MGRLFGTDGVRGVANDALTPETAFAIGRAAAAVLGRDVPRERPIVVGRDTRLSGTMLQAATIAGITSVGRDALCVGVAPTPAIALVATRIGAAAGVVISASHNPIEDNGLKFFGGDGFKLADAIEDEIEAATARDDLPRPTHADVGIARDEPALTILYERALHDAGADLRGLTIVVDAAFGAAYRIAPAALRALGAEVVALHAEDDGARINVGCGATDLRALATRVRALAEEQPERRAFGVAFDGDADRALFVDEEGASVTGDHVLFVIARDLQAGGRLVGDAVVGTVMSNLGLERALRAYDIRLIRASVGDRYVLEAMRAGGYGLGGEQSGHVVDLARNTTGDGPLVAIVIASILARTKATLRALTSELVVAPQTLVNVRVDSQERVARDERVRAAIARAEETLGERGRVLVRPSGTEPLVRVMIEGTERAEIDRLACMIAETIREA